MYLLRTISIFMLTILIVVEIKIFIEELFNEPTLYDIISFILLIIFTFVPYYYIVIK